jgi:thiamine-monophosphate kinase
MALAMKLRTPRDRDSGLSRQGRIGERALVADIRDQANRTGRVRSAVRLGIGDDCAILRPQAGEEIVVTTDFSLEQVHFRRDWHPPESVGHRCLARGLSDVAAMGGRPLAAFLSLAIPVELTLSDKQRSWVARFFEGLLALAAQHKVRLAGGDTAQSPEFDCHGRKSAAMVSADVVLIGSAKRGRALLRSGACAGDIIYVTGELGGAAAELIALGRQPEQFARLITAQKNHPHLYPEPRVGVGLKLASTGIAHAAVDLSDGLSTDLLHVCEESGLTAELDAAAIPVHALAMQAEQDGWVPSALGLALHGGEDYELLFTTPKWSSVPRKIAGVAIHPIGQMQRRHPKRPRVMLRERNGRTQTLEPSGWEHFR